MKLHILTLVLDGMPFLPMQLATFNRLHVDWTWHIVHGAAANRGSTSWCKSQSPRLSTDGSTEFLNSLTRHPRVRVYQSQWWSGGKDEMVNVPLEHIKEKSILLEVDVDELWLPWQIGYIMSLLSQNGTGVGHTALFQCRYFVGPNIVTVGVNCYGNKAGEWARAWRFEPGQKFVTHEPPFLTEHLGTGVIPADATASVRLVFDHWAYVFPHQVAYKEQFYGYANALSYWRRLQNNKQWPVRLRDFLPWTDETAKADLLFK